MKAKLKLQKSKNLYPGNIQLIDIVMLNESTTTSNSPYPYCDSLINSKGTQKGLVFPTWKKKKDPALTWTVSLKYWILDQKKKKADIFLILVAAPLIWWSVTSGESWVIRANLHPPQTPETRQSTVNSNQFSTLYLEVLTWPFLLTRLCLHHCLVHVNWCFLVNFTGSAHG